MSKAKTVRWGRIPSDAVMDWFAKNVGPRTHFTRNNIGGQGWSFSYSQGNPWAAWDWYLTVDDESFLVFYYLANGQEVQDQ